MSGSNMHSTADFALTGQSNEKLSQHTLVLGGARSGKTRRALAWAETRSNRVYIATAEAWDDEMRARIAAHKAERGEGWQTLEAPLELGRTVTQAGRSAQRALDQPAEGAEEEAGANKVAPIEPNATPAIVIDCLTLWLSNLMHHDRNLDAATDELLHSLTLSTAPVVLVSNETGLGIVPENALARRFRDAQGRLNQAVAAAVPRVEFVAAGLPLRLK